jgi:haloalkane dehalogenase
MIMKNTDIPATDAYKRHRVKILDSDMAYVDTGEGDPIVFLHGNPTSSYLWRNVIPQLEKTGRCLAPDLIGMGQSGQAAGGSYRFVDHVRYLDAWIETLSLRENVTLVMHDWGSALGFHWSFRKPERVKALVYMEAIVQPLTWDLWPEVARPIFQSLRSEAGEKLIIEKNVFVERILPASVLRGLGDEEMTVYRQPYLEAGESRRPTLTWPREIPIEGQPADVHEIVAGYAAWLIRSDIPKLFINADPGSILIGKQRDFCRSWARQQEITVKGSHPNLYLILIVERVNPC